MDEYQVTGVSKTDKRCDCITHLSGKTFKKKKVADVVAEIENKKAKYFTNVGGTKAYLQVVEKGTSKYVRTAKDDTPDDNLLSLPESS